MSDVVTQRRNTFDEKAVMQRTDRIRGYDSRCWPFELKGLGAVTPSLLHGLTQQDRVVEHQADRPDPATANECLWISPVARHTHDADRAQYRAILTGCLSFFG